MTCRFSSEPVRKSAYPTYGKDKQLETRYLKQVSKLIGHLFLQPSDVFRDQCENADLCGLSFSPVNIAVRIRRHEYLERYPNQVTFRFARDAKQRTEFGKILDGLGDYFFYGYEDEKGIRLTSWILIDLRAFRWHLKNRKQEIKFGVNENRVDDTSFIWFDLTSFSCDPKVIYAQGNL